MNKAISIITSVALGAGVAVSGTVPASASVSTSAVKYQPLPKEYKISSGYGYRTNPVTHEKGAFHRGLDYPAKCGTPILATLDGYIAHSNWEENGFGWYVQVRNNNTSAMYGHMKMKSHLKVGTKVYRGQRIGYVGETGMSTGCHTHFELRDHTKKGYTNYGKPFNPTSKMKGLKNLSTPIIVKGKIGTYYKKNKSKTGYPRTNEGKIKNPSGYYQRFEKGTVYYSKDSGAHFNMGVIRKAFKTTGYTGGSLGYPTTDNTKFKYNKKAKYQKYQHGMITYSSKTGAKAMTSTMYNKWKSMGSERSVAKLPTKNMKCGLKDGGCYQQFEKGKLHWSKKSGAHFTLDKGAFQRAWTKAGGSSGKLGYPTTDKYKSGSKLKQKYQGGYMTYTKKTGAKVYYKK